jgi:hydrogenase/urease accessory protein HupE
VTAKRRGAIRSLAGAVVGLLIWAPCAGAHESRPAYLEIKEIAPSRYDVLWRTPLLAGARLPILLRLPRDARPVTPPSVRELTDSVVERRVVEIPGGLAGRRIDVVGLEATITDVLVRAELGNSTRVTMVVRPSHPWIEIAATPGRAAVAVTFLLHGLQHIALGMDHLLFVLGLLLIVKDGRTLVETITAFTVAHSITLAIAAVGDADAPVDALNAAIALSILFLGPEIVRSWRNGSSLTIRHPWVVAFLFGLLHGLGFAGALSGAGLPRAELPFALLTFNLGVEVGQLAFVLLILLLERSFAQLEIRWPAWARALPGYAVGSIGAFWTIQRTAILLGAAR